MLLLRLFLAANDEVDDNSGDERNDNNDNGNSNGHYRSDNISGSFGYYNREVSRRSVSVAIRNLVLDLVSAGGFKGILASAAERSYRKQRGTVFCKRFKNSYTRFAASDCVKLERIAYLCISGVRRNGKFRSRDIAYFDSVRAGAAGSADTDASSLPRLLRVAPRSSFQAGSCRDGVPGLAARPSPVASPPRSASIR